MSCNEGIYFIPLPFRHWLSNDVTLKTAMNSWLSLEQLSTLITICPNLKRDVDRFFFIRYYGSSEYANFRRGTLKCRPQYYVDTLALNIFGKSAPIPKNDTNII